MNDNIEKSLSSSHLQKTLMTRTNTESFTGTYKLQDMQIKQSRFCGPSICYVRQSEPAARSLMNTSYYSLTHLQEENPGH